MTEKDNERWRKHYKKNPSIHIARAATRHESIKLIITDGKRKPCADCGIQYESHIMQYDHAKGKKDFGIADALLNHPGKDRLLAEIAKCDIVCANCHADRTYKRRNGILPERTGDRLQNDENTSSNLVDAFNNEARRTDE